MTPDQMTELAARLREQATLYRAFNQTGRDRSADLDAAADLIDSMAQRVPLTPRQMVEGLYQAQQADSDISDAVSFLCGAEWAEKHHGIRSEK